MTAGQQQGVVLSAEDVEAIRAEAVDLGAPQEPTVVDRPDGQPGYTEQLANVELLPGGKAVAAARHRLDKARAQGAHPDDIVRLQRELADASGYELRDVRTVAAPPRPDEAAAAELVATDVLNLPPRGSTRSLLNGDLVAAYEDVLRVAVAMRAVIERNRRATDAAGVEDIPPPPTVRNGSVVVVEGAAWQWRDRQWWPLITGGDFAGLTEEERAAIREHTGLAVPEAGAPRP